jgi:hypothetical protein
MPPGGRLTGMPKARQMMRVERITACARLSDPAELLSYAREAADAGDESWQQWVQEFERGEALVVALELSVELANGASEELRASTRAFFVDCGVPTPHVERQIAEVAYEELVVLVRDQLSARGHPSDLLDCAPMYVHVELDREVRQSLAEAAQRAAGPFPPDQPPPSPQTPSSPRAARPGGSPDRGGPLTPVETPHSDSGMAQLRALARRLRGSWFPLRRLGRPGPPALAAPAASS